MFMVTTHEMWAEIRDLSSGEREEGKGDIAGASRSTVFCTASTTSSMLSSFSRAV
jgi:hypothetical protein